MQYTVKVNGVEGVYVATLYVGNEAIADFEAATIEKANKLAKTYAQRHRLDNKAARVEVYEHTFEL